MRTLNPVWRKTYEFDVKGSDLGSCHIDPTTFEVWDWDALSGNDFMGQCVVDWKALIPHIGQQFTQEYTLGPSPKEATKNISGTLKIGATMEY